jgi:inorganic pyrophosphatase
MSEIEGIVNVYIEIEQFSNQKYEFNKEKGELELDRVLPHPFTYPYAYGFIPNTLAEDGDDLDALIVTNTPLEKGKEYKTRIVGVLIMEDEKGMDEKILCVLEKDYETIQDIGDLPESSLENVKWFFENYKKKDNGKWSKVSGYETKDDAVKLYKKCLDNRNYKNVFVYCGGKCGSSTLFNSLNFKHFKTIQLYSNFYYKKITKQDKSIFNLIDDSCKFFNRVYIIDSYRTPIERKISSFFQNINKYLPNYEQMSINEINTFFKENLFNKIEEYHSINEVLLHYNVPLFSKFNFESRYNIAIQDNKIFIKILFKDIDNWDSILSEIFEENIKINPKNVTKLKKIKILYEKFKLNFRVPKNYIDNVLIKDVEFKIYNSEEDQRKYIEYWNELSE